MIAAKFGDPVIGVDIHMVMVPTPAGPVPTPLPHPFIGIVYDPMGAAVAWGMAAVFGGGGLVLVNGMPCGNTGTEVKGMKHIPTPPGVSPAPNDPPGNEGTLVTGSKTVLFGGSSQSRTGSMVMSCNFPINLPTSVCLAVPMGAPVLIGGPEAIDFAAAATQAIRTKWVSDKLHGLLKAKPGSKISKAICFLTGHPVDVMTGELIAEAIDFELPGMIPVVWERNYRSRETEQGSLGPGWSHPFDTCVEETPRGLVVRLPDGRPSPQPPLAVGASVWEAMDRFRLTRTTTGYEMRTWDGITYTYERIGPASRRHVLMGIRDRAFNHVALTYEHGQLAAITDTAGRVLLVRWTREHRIAGVYFEDRPLVRYTYEDGRLASAMDAHDEPMRYAYRAGVMVRETQRGGLSFHFEWDWEHTEGYCVRTWGDGGIYDRRITYDEARHFTLVEDGRGGRTHYWGNALGLVDKMMDPTGRVTEYAWNEHAQKLAEVDGEGHRREWAYDERGNVVLERDAAGGVTRREYDADNLLRVVVDAAGGRWEIDYDRVGKPLWMHAAGGQGTKCTHDEHGRLVTREDAMGRKLHAAWSPRHDLVALTDGAGRTTTFEHDTMGRVVHATDAAGRVTRIARDTLGRPSHVERADGERLTMAYDAAGNVVEQVDSRGRRVAMTYAGMNRLVAHTDAMGFTVELVYDVEEDLTGVVNQAGEVYEFEVDRAGRVDRETGFDGAKKQYLYDKAGRLSQVIAGDGQGIFVTKLARDAMGRVIRRTLADHTEETYAFDALGALVEATTPDVTLSLTRDALGRVVQERAGEHAIESRYDPSGLRVERRTDLGHRSQYDFDGAGDLRGVSFGLDPRRYSHELAKFGLPQMTQPDWEVRITRDLLGLEVARHLPGGAVATWDRDAFGRPKMRRVTTGASGFARKSTDALKVGYQWRSADEIGALIDAQSGPTRFDYDPRGHLIAALLPDGRVQHRASDAVGNVYATTEKTDRHYGTGGRLERANGSEYRYDSLGQLVEKRLADGAAWKYRWNAAGRLAAVVRPDGGEVRFAYDALGRRVKKECEGRTTEYVWDGDDLVHERERDAEGNLAPMVTWVFEPGTFAPLAKVVGRARYGVVTDHLGTPALFMTEAGEIAWKAQLDVYGVVREEVAKTACPWRWPGQYEDAETGLYYNRFRYYDPEAGRYISPDPIGLLGGTALYGYVHDPLGWVDPWGLHEGIPEKLWTMPTEEILAKVDEYAYRVRPAPKDGTKGLVHRIREQISGAMRPGSKGWQTHATEILTQQKGLRQFLLELQKRGEAVPDGAWKLATQAPPTGREPHAPKGCK